MSEQKFLGPAGLRKLRDWVKTKLQGKVDAEPGKGLSTNDYTSEDRQKLAGLNNYTLPEASADTLGGVKIGAGLSIQEGVLSASGGGEPIPGPAGKDGTTFTPSVDAETGLLSWSNTDGKPNPESVNIRGPKGEDGAPGPTGPTGPQGPAGQNGKDGAANITASTEDMTPGESPLTEGALYIVYE